MDLSPGLLELLKSFKRTNPKLRIKRVRDGSYRISYTPLRSRVRRLSNHQYTEIATRLQGRISYDGESVWILDLKGLEL